LVLTGTPIENSLTDLWSQMNFVNTGLLGNFNYFLEEFVKPIEKEHDIVKQEQLQILIKPFILRRKKEQVAKDLPPVNEQVIFCEMLDEQEKIYEQEKSKIRNEILLNIEKDGIAKASFLAIQGLTRLRQIANHPVLLDKEMKMDSGKFEIIKTNIETLISEKHNVLIFSSFVKHLSLLEDYFKAQNWNYSLLTGEMSKENRQKAIDSFQNNTENRLFLISIKAGGVGLNLTAADYVFILDPWWNPAVELQAINRAHRIGQDKNVFVYRFISLKTVEQKIRQLQEEKATLAEIFINSNNPFLNFDKEKLIEFFE
jgi:SNF2 family DNA or RNA helicase